MAEGGLTMSVKERTVLLVMERAAGVEVGGGGMCAGDIVSAMSAKVSAVRGRRGSGTSAHSPQAKGRVERGNKVYQDRLVKELRLAGISDMAAANDFLTAAASMMI